MVPEVGPRISLIDDLEKQLETVDLAGHVLDTFECVCVLFLFLIKKGFVEKTFSFLKNVLIYKPNPVYNYPIIWSITCVSPSVQDELFEAVT